MKDESEADEEKGSKKREKGLSKWEDFHLVTLYRFARDGLSNHTICKAMDIDDETLKRWLKKRPEAVRALEEGRKKREGMKSYREYVYGKLPRELQRLWEKINKFEAFKGRPLERVQALLSTTPTEAKQHLFLYALIDCNFIISQACSKLGMSVKVLEEWRKDVHFGEMLTLMDEWRGDFFEGALVNLIKSGDSAAIIFANRTYNRKRGYNDKQEIELAGKVEHKHTFDLKSLPLEVRKEIMRSLKEKGELTDPDHLELKPVPDEVKPGKLLFKKREPVEVDSEKESEGEES